MSAPLRIGAAEARRIALAAQGFGARRPSGPVGRSRLSALVSRVGCLQIDSVNVLVRSHYLPAFSRLGPYPLEALDRMAHRRPRALFEYWAHEASYVPVGLHPLLRWRMARAGGEAWGRMRRMQRDRPGYVEGVFREVAERGPLTVSELSEPGSRSAPWWGWGDGKAALEWLFWMGRVTSAGRRRFERLYDLPERVLSPDVLAAPTPPEEESHRRLLDLAARALGVATAADLADYFRLKVTEARPRIAELVESGALVPAAVEGWAQPAFLHAEARVPRSVTATALLSPFDPLVWFRPRVERMFGMHLRLELYTPAPLRRYGYYVLPFLHDERLVGRVDLKADRRAGLLRVPAVHLEPGEEEGALAEPLAGQLRTVAAWLGLPEVDVAGTSSLARRVRAGLAS